MSEGWAVRATTSKPVTWWVRRVASRLDPVLFRASGGRFTSMGVPAMPMVTVSTVGAKTGRLRPVHLACIERGGERFVVASAMGQQRHPGWSYNLEAHPEVEVQASGERYAAMAELLSDAEKDALWPQVKAEIPQMKVYEARTNRKIRVFRLRRAESAQAS